MVDLCDIVGNRRDFANQARADFTKPRTNLALWSCAFFVHSVQFVAKKKPKMTAQMTAAELIAENLPVVLHIKPPARREFLRELNSLRAQDARGIDARKAREEMALVLRVREILEKEGRMDRLMKGFSLFAGKRIEK